MQESAWIVLLTAALAATALPSQQQPSQAAMISAAEAADHLLQKSEPVYPEFAKAAGIEGVVSFRVSIRPDGHIRGVVRPGSGPPALEQAAQDALQTYVYRPFERDGKPLAVQAIVEVPFVLPAGAVPHRYPVPAISLNSFFSRDSMRGEQIEYSLLSPRMQTWYKSYLGSNLFGWMKGEEKNFAVDQALRATTVEEIHGLNARSHVYLLEPQSEGACGMHNCAVALVEERADEIQLVGEYSFNGYFLRPRAGSAFPDVFLSAHEGMNEVDFVGYANIGGHWGELYCGTLVADPRGGKAVIHPCASH